MGELQRARVQYEGKKVTVYYTEKDDRISVVDAFKRNTAYPVEYEEDKLREVLEADGS